jgi:catechol 2,3-dioxygenase-like lactoylglutathione lyase family enzyme
VISEIRMTTLGVADLERAVRFYRDGFGMVELGRATLDPAWGEPVGTEVAILAADERRVSVLRLLRPAEPDAHWTDGRAVYDHGHYALNYHARDVTTLLPRLKAHGMQPAPWIDGEVTTTRWDLAHATVVDSMFRDPDGTLIDTFTLLKGAEAHEPFDGDVSGLECMAIQTGDMARSRAFYEGFGHEPLYDHMVDPPPFLGYGDGTRVHNVNLRMRDRKPGRVELVQHFRVDGALGASSRGLAELPRLGILSVGFEAEDLSAADETFRALGAEPEGPERRAALPGLGETHTRAYFGPDGERLELFHLTERESSWPV